LSLSTTRPAKCRVAEISELFLPKIDWQMNSNHQFTATYNRLRWKSPAGVQTGATVTRDRAGFGDDFVESIHSTCVSLQRCQASSSMSFASSGPMS
jgi:hypothetical protein